MYIYFLPSNELKATMSKMQGKLFDLEILIKSTVQNFQVTNNSKDKVYKEFLVHKISERAASFTAMKISRDLSVCMKNHFPSEFIEGQKHYKRNLKRYYLGITFKSQMLVKEHDNYRKLMNNTIKKNYYLKKEGKNIIKKTELLQRQTFQTDLPIVKEQQSYQENNNISLSIHEADKEKTVNECNKELLSCLRKLQLENRNLKDEIQIEKMEKKKLLQEKNKAIEAVKQQKIKMNELTATTENILKQKQEKSIDFEEYLRMKHKLQAVEELKIKLEKAKKQVESDFIQLRFAYLKEVSQLKEKEEKQKRDFCFIQKRIIQKYSDQYNNFELLSLELLNNLIFYSQIDTKDMPLKDLGELITFLSNKFQIRSKLMAKFIDPSKGNMRSFLFGLKYVRNVRSHKLEQVNQELLKYGYDNLYFLLLDLKIFNRPYLFIQFKDLISKISEKRKEMYELCWRIFIEEE